MNILKIGYSEYGQFDYGYTIVNVSAEDYVVVLKMVGNSWNNRGK